MPLQRVCRRRVLCPDIVDVDAAIMLSAKGGDPRALDALVRKHGGPVRRYVYGVVRDEAVAEELVQEVFLRVHRHRMDYQPTAKFTSWLFRIANHIALNWLRDHACERSDERLDAQTAHRRQLPSACARIDDLLVLEAKRNEVRCAVNELPERQRTVVRLHKFEELECEEIGAMLGCTNQAVRSLLCRAYKTLRESLAHVSMC